MMTFLGSNYQLWFLPTSICEIMEIMENNGEKKVIERQDGTKSHAINRGDVNIGGGRR